MLAEDYFKKLKAPYKKLILFENSSHLQCFEEPGKFVEAMACIATAVKKSIEHI